MTSIDMHPASAAASASTGDGPAAACPSSMKDDWCVVTENVSALASPTLGVELSSEGGLASPKLGVELSSEGGPPQARSTTVGGLPVTPAA